MTWRLKCARTCVVVTLAVSLVEASYGAPGPIVLNYSFAKPAVTRNAALKGQ